MAYSAFPLGYVPYTTHCSTYKKQETMTIKLNKCFGVFLMFIIIQSCSNDDSVDTGMIPSKFLQGTWSSPFGLKLRYTFTSDNIIEENLDYIQGTFKSTNFREEYPLEEYNIEEEIIPFNQELNQSESYIIKITRKDGGIIDPIEGNIMVYRKFDNVKLITNEVINETILLDFSGYNGTFLYKE